MSIPEVMGVAEIAIRLRVSKARVRQFVRQRHFPDGRRLTMGEVWATADIEEWIARYRPGDIGNQS